LENNEKVAKLDNEYKDEFQQIDELIEEYLADENNEILNKLANLIKVIV
jgi:predicted house-cleaning noncanonical NTP pyrophosphatase (MazG superfamily)